MKVCFVGTGSIGKRHIRNLLAICKEKGIEIDIHLLRNTMSELPEDVISNVSRQTISIQELDTDYDAIFICNPTHLHYKVLGELKSHSKFFFVEKPLFENIERDLAALSLPQSNIYYVACPLRYTRVLVEAKRITENEKVLSARAISTSYLPEWRKKIDYRKTYSAHKDQGGGVRIDLIHEWDYLIELFGSPLEVYSMYGKYSELEIDSEDIAIYIARYADKLVELHLDYFGRKTRRLLELRTVEHEYIFDINNAIISRDGELMIDFEEEINERYKVELLNFIEIMSGRKTSNNDLQKAINTMQVCVGVSDNGDKHKK